MNSTQLFNQLDKLGFFLVQRKGDEGKYWFVGDVRTHNGYNCRNLAEVKSLLQALRSQAENGGGIVHDGSEWIVVD